MHKCAAAALTHIKVQVIAARRSQALKRNDTVSFFYFHLSFARVKDMYSDREDVNAHETPQRDATLEITSRPRRPTPARSCR
jgi:hypothetical protein